MNNTNTNRKVQEFLTAMLFYLILILCMLAAANIK